MILPVVQGVIMIDRAMGKERILGLRAMPGMRTTLRPYDPNMTRKPTIRARPQYVHIAWPQNTPHHCCGLVPSRILHGPTARLITATNESLKPHHPLHSVSQVALDPHASGHAIVSIHYPSISVCDVATYLHGFTRIVTNTTLGADTTQM